MRKVQKALKGLKKAKTTNMGIRSIVNTTEMSLILCSIVKKSKGHQDATNDEKELQADDMKKKFDRKCFACGINGHTKQFCCNEANNWKRSGIVSNSENRKMICFGCGKEGHKVSECRKWQNDKSEYSMKSQGKLRCFACDSENHKLRFYSKFLSWKRGSFENTKRENKCFECGGEHLRKFCPKLLSFQREKFDDEVLEVHEMSTNLRLIKNRVRSDRF
jgi:hypothetical protein